jgi:hypothetical protein
MLSAPNILASPSSNGKFCSEIKIFSIPYEILIKKAASTAKTRMRR